jgi:glycosyltransferase involved in cell wall biosynthesis
MRARSIYAAFDVFPRPKGSSSHIASMITALSREFAPLTLLCLGAPDLPLYQREGSIEILRLPATDKDPLRRAEAFAAFVHREVAARAAGLERLVFRDPWGGVPALRAAPGVPSLFEVNALPGWELAYSRPGFDSSPALQAKLGDMERFCLSRATKLLCVSDVTRRALLEECGRQAIVIPNAASAVYFQASGQPDPLLCGYAGGLHAWQGVEFFLGAFAAAQVDGARMWIIHSGNRPTRDIERRIARLGLDGRVECKAPMEPAALANAFRQMRFSAAPLAETSRNTRQGCCPVKIIESLAAGTPVLASDLAVTREWIMHGGNGWLAAPGDTRAWAHAIRRAFSETLTVTGAERFAWPAIHARLQEVFR